MKQVPFRFSGSRGLYSLEEIKILVSFIKALTDFEDSQSLFYLALSEIYGMDPYDLTVLSNHAHKRNLALHQVFKKVAEGDNPEELSSSTITVVKRIIGDISFFAQTASRQNAGTVLFSFLERTGHLKSLAAASSLAAELKIKNIRLFFDKIKDFSKLTDDDSVHSFARHLDLLQQVGDNPATAEAELEEDAVSVLTVHKAKGLEFAVVFLVCLIGDRFPGRERREKIPVPDEIFKEKLPGEENYLQEERRLFYVGMTRAKHLLYLTWARDYGLKRPKKVSPFVLEALDMPKMPEEILRASALEEISRYAAPVRMTETLSQSRVPDILTLSYFQVEDYLTCPLKYRFRHMLRIPVLPRHTLIFGRVLHTVIHFYLRQKMAGIKVAEDELLEEYERSWVNEGYLSREHEEMRKKEGKKALRRFYRHEEAFPGGPGFLEKSFKWQERKVRFIGRWDRIDFREEGAVIIDFKASEVKDQKEADKRTQESRQMDLYALSFLKTQETPLWEAQLYFLESGHIGHAGKGEANMAKAEEQIFEVEAGIRNQNFVARPDWHNCSYCDFKTICPCSYAY